MIRGVVVVVVVGVLVGFVHQTMVRGSKEGGYDLGRGGSYCKNSTVAKTWLPASLLTQLVIVDCGCAVMMLAFRVVDPVS